MCLSTLAAATWASLRRRRKVVAILVGLLALVGRRRRSRRRGELVQRLERVCELRRAVWRELLLLEAAPAP